MTELEEGDELRLMLGGEVVGTGVVLADGNASFQLDNGAVFQLRDKLVGGYSIAAEVSEGPRPSVGPVPEPVAGRPCGCLPGEECMFCRNSFAFRREVRPSFPEPDPVFVRRNWEAIQDELGVNLRGEPVPGFTRAPFPFPVRVDTEVRPGVVRIEGGGQLVEFEVEALLCSTSSHAGTVPAVVSGRFRVPWWGEERTEPAAYCGSCARLLGFMGYFTPDEEGQG